MALGRPVTNHQQRFNRPAPEKCLKKHAGRLLSVVTLTNSILEEPSYKYTQLYFVESTEGDLDGVYCHCDGYLEGRRVFLKEADSGTENAQKRHYLIALGDLSSLGRSLEPSVAVELFRFGYYMKPEVDKLSQQMHGVLSLRLPTIVTVRGKRR